MTYDRPLLGIFLMIGFCVLMPVSDAIAKFLSHSIPLGILLLARFSMQTLLLLPFVYQDRQSLPMSWRIFKLVIIRTFLQVMGIGAMFLALSFLPLADALAIAFVMPFIMLLLGKYVLGEQVGKHRLLACVVGFVGTLLVIQPNFASVGLPALLPLIVAVAFALFMLVTRKIAKEINPINLQAISGVLATAVVGLVYVVFPTGHFPGFELVMPDFTQGLLLGLTGAIGTMGHLLMTWSLRFAPSTTLAPMQYIEIPAATLVGWLVFKDLPNGMAGLGIAITMSAGLYAILRENRMDIRKTG